MSEHPSEVSVDASTQPSLSKLCSQVVVAINNVLFRYFASLLPEDERYSFDFNLYKGNPFRYGDTHKCHETRTLPGLYYAISGSYGLEYILSDEQREKLYANGVGAYDIDVKIIFDEEKVPDFVKKAIAKKSKLKRGYDTTKFYYTLMRKIIRSLEPYLVPRDGMLMDVEGMGLLFNADESRIDVLVAPLSMCYSLRNFFEFSPGSDNRNWKYDFAIFDSLRLFILCKKIGYDNDLACSNDHLRLAKLERIVFRACVIAGVKIPTLTGGDMGSTESVLKALKETVDAVYTNITSTSFERWLMMRYIGNLDIANNDGYKYKRIPGGGTGEICVDGALDNAKSSTIDALTLREMFGYDPKGRIKIIETGEELGKEMEEDQTEYDPNASEQTGAGLGDRGHELGLSALGMLVALAAALASTATR